MSTWKNASENAAKPSVDSTVTGTTDIDAPPTSINTAREVAIVSLDVDLEPEDGGDPYNSTGKHLVDKIRKYED